MLLYAVGSNHRQNGSNPIKEFFSFFNTLFGKMFGIYFVLHFTVEIISGKMFHTLFSAKQKRGENVNYVSKIRYFNSPRLK